MIWEILGDKIRYKEDKIRLRGYVKRWKEMSVVKLNNKL